MQRASWRLSKILCSSSRVISFYTREHRPKGENPLALLPLKRPSRKGTVHLSKMTSAVPTCSPKDLCSKRESLSKSPFVRATFSDELGNSVPTRRVQSWFSSATRREEPLPAGLGYNGEGNIHYPRFYIRRRRRRENGGMENNVRVKRCRVLKIQREKDMRT